MFQLHGLPAEPFQALFPLDATALARHHARRVVATSHPGFPCRVSLVDAQIGEELLLLPFEHMAAASPYRASGPIFVRRGARTRELCPGEVPDYVRRRLISIRAYDADHLMLQADVCSGEDVAATLETLLHDPHIDYLHLHNARQGCFSCRVTRA